MKLQYSIPLLFILLIACTSKNALSDKSHFVQNGAIDFTNLYQLPPEFFAKDSVSRNRESPNHYDFRKAKDIAGAFELFCDEFESARKVDQLPVLFNRFCYSRAVQDQQGSPEMIERVMKQWIARAIAEKDESVKALYSHYNHQISSRGLQFSCPESVIRPGGSYRINSWSSDQSKRQQEYVVTFDRVTFDKKMKPIGFKTVQVDTITKLDFKEFGLHYVQTIAEVGVYKVTITNELTFFQAYVQATNLDGLLKSDGEKILVYGSSYKESTPAPYTVHFIAKSGKVVSLPTGANGALAVGHPFRSDSLRKKLDNSVKVVIQQGEDLAFIDGTLHGASNFSTRVHYLYTDRPVYRPGDRVYIRGINRLMSGDRTLSNDKVDSVQLLISNPENQKHKTLWVKPDRWGHFGDSLVLDSLAKQGRWTVSVQDVKSKEMYRSSNGVVSFLVEAYKKPEFIISATAQDSTVVEGNAIKIDVKGEYYFGGFMSNVPVKVRWFRDELHHSFYEFGGKRRAQFYPAGDREFLFEEDATLNSHGELQLVNMPILRVDHEYLTAEVIVTDKSRREVRTECEVKVVKKNGYLSFSLNKEYFETGDTAQIELTAVDLDGNRLKSPLKVRVKKGNLIVMEKRVTVNNEGSAYLDYLISSDGEYTVEAETKDRDGKTIFREERFSSRSNLNWNEWEYIDVISDKKEYVAGDTATITIKTGADTGRVLCTVEGASLFEASVKGLSDHIITYRLPIQERWGKTVNFIVSFSGKERIISSTSTFAIRDSSSLLKASLKGNTRLKPGDRFTGVVKVTDRKGKPVMANFSAALVDEGIFAVAKESERNDWNGSSQQKGVLSIFPNYYNQYVRTQENFFSVEWFCETSTLENLLSASATATSSDHFGKGGYASGIDVILSGVGGLRGGGRGSQTVLSDEIELEHSTRKGVLGIGFGGGNGGGDEGIARGGNPEEPIRERKEFRDLGYWNGSITTNEQGEAKLSFTMPDDLTKWRLVLVGSDGVKQFLEFHDSLYTKQDIMVKLEAPRSVVEGDSLLVTSVIHNYSDKAIKAKVAFKFQNDLTVAKILTKSTANIYLAAGETKRVDWPVKILKKGSFNCYTEVRTDSGNDAESRSYPILINGISRTVSFVGSVTEKNGVLIDGVLPADGKKGSREVTITYSPSLAVSLFESLEYLHRISVWMCGTDHESFPAKPLCCFSDETPQSEE